MQRTLEKLDSYKLILLRFGLQASPNATIQPPLFERVTRPILFISTLRNICHVICFFSFFVVYDLDAQTYRPTLPSAPSAQENPALPANPDERPLPSTIAGDVIRIRAVTQEAEGPLRHLRGSVIIETGSMVLKADELDYNDDSGDVVARGHVHFEHFQRGEKLDCDRLEYNVNTETGKFYEVTGSVSPRIQARRGMLTTTNPFYFEGNLAERLKDTYILHDGFLTDCKVPDAWWRLKSKSFMVTPGDHATTRNSVFYLRNIPVFYFPFFYKSLRKEARHSGFLTPNIGNSSTRGFVIGLGYYWAINRSYDLTYRTRYFSNAGLAHHIDFRGDPAAKSVFDLVVDGIKDKRPLTPSPSGVLISSRIRSELKGGWEARGELNYISSYGFRLRFTESFNEAVFSQTHSVGFLTKHWSDYGFTVVAQQNVNFQTTLPGDSIGIRKLPEAQFIGREHQFDFHGLPFWISFDSSAGLERRTQNLFQTRQFVPRLDMSPRITTALRWKDIHLIPTFGVRETFYDSSVTSANTFSGGNLWRNSREVSMDLLLPALARVFDMPYKGSKWKHVIEPRITYRNVSGINNFQNVILFDETDVLANTHQVQFSLNNRLLAKSKDGVVTDFVNWQLWYDRYFDPTFGGAIVPGRRNAIEPALELTGYGYLTGARRDSPIVSALRVQSRLGLEWRTDWDPRVGRIVNSSLAVDARARDYFVSLAHTNLRADPILIAANPLLAPTANQFRGSVGYGGENRRGLSYGFAAYYDFNKGVLQYTQTQLTYNTDCCGLSVQFRRFNLGARNETQFRVAFAISNIGTFGNLKRQERIF